MKASEKPVVLLTGAARRVGRVLARTLHAAGYDVALHYRSSKGEAEQLAAELEHARAGSTLLLAVSLSFFVNRTRGQVELLRQDGLSKPAGWWQSVRHGFAKGAIGRNVLGPWVEFFRPGFHPHTIDDRELLVRGENLLAAIKLVTEGTTAGADRTSSASRNLAAEVA